MEVSRLLELENDIVYKHTNNVYVDITARRMGVDAGEIGMITSQPSLRRMSSQMSRVRKFCYVQ